jgi:hypothetical protein
MKGMFVADFTDAEKIDPDSLKDRPPWWLAAPCHFIVPCSQVKTLSAYLPLFALWSGRYCLLFTRRQL